MKQVLRFLSCFLAFWVGFSSFAAEKTKSSKKSKEKTEEKKVLETTQWGGDQSRFNRKTQVIELRGNAYLSRNYEHVEADEIDFNKETAYVHARGRVRYQFSEYFVKADSIELDLNANTGTIINGNISNGQFALRGKQMDQIEPNHYLVKDYNYTTCFDCPNAWEMTGKQADIRIEGYAFIDNFIFKIKEASLMWLPFMVVPIKSRRQSGLLMPKWGSNTNFGAMYVQPYYWATNDWSDMTISAGTYSNLGFRAEAEARYALTKQSQGLFNFYYTRDQTVPRLQYRWAGKIGATQELPWGFDAKLRAYEVSDSGYPIIYTEDVPGRYEPVLSSDLFASRSTPQMSTVISLRRLRNLLYFDRATPNPNFISGFDYSMVQEFPRVVVSSNDQFIGGTKIAAGVETHFSRFTRGSESFDRFSTDPNDPTKFQSIIREANRFTLIPGLYTTLNAWHWLSIVPSVQYRSFLYSFNGSYDSLARGYLLAKTDFSFQIEKVYATSQKTVEWKHTIRPTFTYSVIPTIQQTSAHPFIQQVQQNGRPGQYFDNDDIVPLGTSQNLETYFTPLGHSFTYGLTTDLYKRYKAENGRTLATQRRAQIRFYQTFDILESTKYVHNGQKGSNVLLSPFFFFMDLNDGAHVSSHSEYTYYSFLDRYNPNNAQLDSHASPHRFSESIGYTLERGYRQGLLRFDRSVSMSYSYSRLSGKTSYLSATATYSLNDYIMPSVNYAIDLMSNPRVVVDAKYSLLFQSPSHCWQLQTSLDRTVDRGTSFDFSFALNLTGGSFAGDTAPGVSAPITPIEPNLDDQLRKQ